MRASFRRHRNYAEMLTDPSFRNSLTNTLVYSAIVVPGLGRARPRRGPADRGGHLAVEAFYRAVYFLPVMATLIAMAIVWESHAPSAASASSTSILKSIGHSPHDWLRTSSSCCSRCAASASGRALGFNMVLFMAGLTADPARPLRGRGGRRRRTAPRPVPPRHLADARAGDAVRRRHHRDPLASRCSTRCRC